MQCPLLDALQIAAEKLLHQNGRSELRIGTKEIDAVRMHTDDDLMLLLLLRRLIFLLLL